MLLGSREREVSAREVSAVREALTIGHADVRNE